MFEYLSSRFGDLAGAQPGYLCTDNGLHNSLLCFYAGLVGHDGLPLLRAYSVQTPTLSHVYSVYETDVRSQKWTCIDNYYPELDWQSLLNNGGQDWTTILFKLAIQPSPNVNSCEKVITTLEHFCPGLISQVFSLNLKY